MQVGNLRGEVVEGEPGVELHAVGRVGNTEGAASLAARLAQPAGPPPP